MRKSRIERKILDYLLISGAVILALQHPVNMSRFFRQLPRDLRKYKEIQLRRALHRLKKQSRIEYIKEDDDNIVVRITKDGRDFLEKINFDTIILERPNIWDKKWRLVIFDVPEKEKSAREALREKLKDLGMKKLQHSIWITPFSCEKEIKLIKTVFNLSDYWIDVIITENIGMKEYQMRKYFDLI
ncbi:MAG: CRISPR-associated endonuclease Cas2 [Candidatus Azambacteria bacterium]|nr:CRISPR-associated endonuclease Cas2 [Candidatus Azambacteria bacterium]